MDEITRSSAKMMLNECNKKVSEFAIEKEVAIEEEIEINVDQRVVNMKGLKKKFYKTGLKSAKSWHEKWQGMAKKKCFFKKGDFLIIFISL